MKKVALQSKDFSPANCNACEMQAFEDELNAAICRAGTRSCGSCQEALNAIAVLSDDRPDLLHRVLDAGRLQAHGVQIVREIGLLLGSFPASITPDPKIYTEMMVEEVTVCRPSVLALKRACSKLRRTLRWPPSIAEMLETIRSEEVRLRDQSEALHPDRRKRALEEAEGTLLRLQAAIVTTQAELPTVLELEADGYPVQPSSVDLQREIARLKGENRDDLPWSG